MQQSQRRYSTIQKRVLGAGREGRPRSSVSFFSFSILALKGRAQAAPELGSTFPIVLIFFSYFFRFPYPVPPLLFYTVNFDVRVHLPPRHLVPSLNSGKFPAVKQPTQPRSL